MVLSFAVSYSRSKEPPFQAISRYCPGLQGNIRYVPLHWPLIFPLKVVYNSYTMCTCGLPDIYYTLSPRASGVYIRWTTRAHGMTIKYVCAISVGNEIHNYTNNKFIYGIPKSKWLRNITLCYRFPMVFFCL